MSWHRVAGALLALSIASVPCAGGEKQDRTGKEGLHFFLSSKQATCRVGEPLKVDLRIENRSKKPINIQVRGWSWDDAAKFEKSIAEQEKALRKILVDLEQDVATLEEKLRTAKAGPDKDKLEDLLQVRREDVAAAKQEQALIAQSRLLTEGFHRRGPRILLQSETTNVATAEEIGSLGTTGCVTAVKDATLPPGKVHRWSFTINTAKHHLFSKPGTYDLVYILMSDAPDTHAPGRRSNPLRIKILPAPESSPETNKHPE